MEFYKTCKTLSIYSFNEILKDNDFRYLIKGFLDFEDDDDEEKFKLGVEETIEARGIFREILYEYSAITANRHIMLKYYAEIKIKEEEFRYFIIESILKNYEEFECEDVLEILNRIDIKFDIEGNIEQQILGVLIKAKRLRTKIALLKSKYNEKFNKNIKNRVKEEVIDKLEEEAIQLGIALKLSYEINTRQISVQKWVNMWSVAGKMNKPVNTH